INPNSPRSLSSPSNNFPAKINHRHPCFPPSTRGKAEQRVVGSWCLSIDDEIGTKTNRSEGVRETTEE
ncbi:unnamed protein product, partial [Linum tenue]